MVGTWKYPKYPKIEVSIGKIICTLNVDFSRAMFVYQRVSGRARVTMIYGTLCIQDGSKAECTGEFVW
jgi:hypothetical protein